jgi:3-oxoadipate enol-lactonase
MPKIQVNGIDLYYEVHGDGPAIVFAHGAGGNHLSWWQQVPVFTRQYCCITFDHRGFGQSSDNPNGPGSQAFVEDLKQLLDHLKIERASPVAQSMGKDLPGVHAGVPGPRASVGYGRHHGRLRRYPYGPITR